MMNDDLTKSVQDAIKEYIDNVGDKKIEDRTLEKLDKFHKDFIENFYIQYKPEIKECSEIRIEIEKIKKEKVPKNSSKEEKITFSRKLIDELFSLVKDYCAFENFVESYENFLEKVKFIKSWNIYEQWFSWALEFGEDSYLATHIAKLTHSSSKGSSVDVRYYDSCNKFCTKYVSTVKNPILDTAYPDNKYSSISQLYNNQVGEYFIGDLLREGDEKYLRPFTKHDELLKLWTSGLSKSIKNENKKSYFLSKQTYFPTQNRQYHLLMPLTSSSLVHALHLEHKEYWDEEQESARKQKSNKKYSTTVTCTYPNKAYLHVTGSNHSNASSLNGKRGGRIALLPTTPPQWRSQPSSYLNRVSIFDKSLSYELKEEINDLRNYLILIKNKSLSISEPKRNAAVMNKLQAISSQFFNYLETINANETSTAWTINSKLPAEQQLAFEPWRQDEVAKALKLDNAWQKTLSQNYGRWLNQQLSQKGKLKLTPIQASLWTDCFLLELREMVSTQEVGL
jgi:CRISPR-associated protein Csy1